MTGIFVVAAHLAAARVEAMTAADFPAAHTIDHRALTDARRTPCAGTFSCCKRWATSMCRVVQPWRSPPALIRADRCARFSVGSPTRPPQTAPSRRDATAIRWREFSMHKGLLSTLAASHCDARGAAAFRTGPVRHCGRDRMEHGRSTPRARDEAGNVGHSVGRGGIDPRALPLDTALGAPPGRTCWDGSITTARSRPHDLQHPRRPTPRRSPAPGWAPSYKPNRSHPSRGWAAMHAPGAGPKSRAGLMA